MRTVLVSGSSGGIGGAVAAFLREAGARVIGLDVRDAEVITDLSTAEGRRLSAAAVLSQTGGSLDAIVACAGVASPDVEAMIGVNYFGTVALIEAMRDVLAGSPDPRVVAISSSATILPTAPALVEACLAGDEAEARRLGKSEPNIVYASTKRALSRWIRRTAVRPDWAGAGILLNGVAPGTVRTPMTAPILATDEGRAMLAQATPIATPDYADPQDLAPLLAFLASAQCRYMVGQLLFVDGGKDCIRRGDDIWQ